MLEKTALGMLEAYSRKTRENATKITVDLGEFGEIEGYVKPAVLSEAFGPLAQSRKNGQLDTEDFIINTIITRFVDASGRPIFPRGSEAKFRMFNADIVRRLYDDIEAVDQSAVKAMQKKMGGDEEGN